LQQQNPRTPKYGGIFDLDSRSKTLEVLREQSSNPDFWNDNQGASSILKKISRIEKEIALWSDLTRRHDDMEVLFEFAEEGETGLDEIQNELNLYQKIIDDVEMKLILGKPEDIQNAIMAIHPGAGGTESQDWAQMLYRMYKRWAEKEDFKIEIIDLQPGDEAGIKDVTFEIKGDYAFGMAKAEAGVHRMVRISPFDSGARRHTSFASVWVYPVVDDSIKVDIQEKDIRVDTYKSSGKGGQSVNTTDSAVRITHLPTNIVVQCQNERSQHKNKETCFNMLKARLYKHEIQKKEEASENLAKSKTDIGWGHQIRSYVLQPYQLVKDLRSNLENTDPDSVLDGDIDGFLESVLYQTKEKNK